MSSVQIKRVETKKDLKAFIECHYDLYEGNQYDAPNLYSDELNTLSKDKNAAFDFCEAEYFLALKEGKVVGRVAAIINNKANEKWDKKDVRFGWIDFIDDIEVSKALLKAVEDYGREKGMTSVVGPLGFTDMDPERYNLHARKLTKKEIFEGGYGKKLFDLINVTYSHLYGFSELSERQIDQYVKMYFPLADLDLITVVEDGNKDNQLVGLAITIPSLTRALQKCLITVVEDGNKDNQLVGLAITIPSLTRALQKCHRGRLFPFGWWHLLRAIKFHKTEVVDLLLIGVLPEYRSKGANSLVFADLIPRYVKYGFKWGETHVEMETNESVQSQWGPLDPTMHKKRRCYRKAIG